MRITFRHIAPVLVLAAVMAYASSCQPGRPQSKDMGEKIKKEIVAVQEAAPSIEAGIRGVDFKNHTYMVEGDACVFTHGAWNGEAEDAGAEVKDVIYGDIMGNGREQAVVVLAGNWGGGNLESGSVQVFDFAGGKAWEVASMPGTQASIQNNLLNVTYQDWAKDDPLCCPTLMVTDIYRWNGLTFIKEMSETTAVQE